MLNTKVENTIFKLIFLIKLNLIAKLGQIINFFSCLDNLSIRKIDKELAMTGDIAYVTFRFKFNPEFVEINSQIVFREGNTKGIGTITKIHEN